eukprot:TRINITY_DN1705_c0_g1_i2.p1 TRINITY_DN1705_c0_g1~~TRINITY_DN1705_c0_g1_i2.p1  ORF type:complete len:340 (-),score=7.03 TRINITY_DN1705_c0_g1_i2:10-1029(-)
MISPYKQQIDISLSSPLQRPHNKFFRILFNLIISSYITLTIIIYMMKAVLSVIGFLLLFSAPVLSAFTLSSDPKGLAYSIDFPHWYCKQSVPNQGTNCSSGWAYAVTLALQQRYCAKYGWNYDWGFSAQQIVSCSKSHGCEGGTVEEALLYAEQEGLATEMCYPYEGVKDPVCKEYRSSCPSQIEIDLGKIYKAKNVTKIPKEKVMEEMRTNGALIACFNLYDDFFDFFNENKFGIYPPHKPANKKEGLLCGTIMGYIQQGGTNKRGWLLEGSWGKDFGDEGYFAVEINCTTRDLQLEENVWSADPQQVGQKGFIYWALLLLYRVLMGYYKQQLYRNLQ